MLLISVNHPLYFVGQSTEKKKAKATKIKNSLSIDTTLTGVHSVKKG